LDLPRGAACFVDANIFYYALVPTEDLSQQCIDLLNRAINGDITVATSTGALSDAVHKVMMSEAGTITGRQRPGIVAYIKRHPEVIARLVRYPQALQRLMQVPIEVFPEDEKLLHAAMTVVMEHNLLTNDAKIVALARRHRILHLATNDDDFDRVPGLIVWKPR
jgi:predicted nucleic acid-binding protein